MHEFVICNVELEIVGGVCGDVVRVKVRFHLVPMFSLLVVVVMIIMVIMMIVIVMVMMVMVLMLMILVMLMTVSTVVMMIFIVIMSMIMCEPMVVTVEVLAVLQQRRPVPVSAVAVSPHHLQPRHHGEAEHDCQRPHQPGHPVPAQLVPRQHLEEGDVE